MFCFSIGNLIIPTDFPIFQRRGSTTNQTISGTSYHIHLNIWQGSGFYRHPFLKLELSLMKLVLRCFEKLHHQRKSSPCQNHPHPTLMIFMNQLNPFHTDWLIDHDLRLKPGAMKAHQGVWPGQGAINLLKSHEKIGRVNDWDVNAAAPGF